MKTKYKTAYTKGQKLTTSQIEEIRQAAIESPFTTFFLLLEGKFELKK